MVKLVDFRYFSFLFFSFDLIGLLEGLLVAYFEYFLCAALNLLKKEKNIKIAIICNACCHAICNCSFCLTYGGILVAWAAFFDPLTLFIFVLIFCLFFFSANFELLKVLPSGNV